MLILTRMLPRMLMLIVFSLSANVNKSIRRIPILACFLLLLKQIRLLVLIQALILLLSIQVPTNRSINENTNININTIISAALQI